MSEEFSLDWPHGWQTFDGRDARILATDLPGLFPVAIAYPARDGDQWVCDSVTTDGRRDIGDDKVPLIINKPVPKREWWVNAYDDGRAHVYDSRGIADQAALCAHMERTACVKIAEGEGL